MVYAVGAGGKRAAWRAGIIEYWSATTLKQPGEGLAFRFKLDTDLYALAKAKTVARSLEVSRDGAQFSVVAADRRAPCTARPAMPAVRTRPCVRSCGCGPPLDPGTRAPTACAHRPGRSAPRLHVTGVRCAPAGACACSAS